MREKLSSLVDAEINGAERQSVYQALAHDRDLRQAWERYHVIRSAMRNEPALALPSDFADRIAAKIQTAPATVVSFPRSLLNRRHVARGAAGLAVAASVAALSIIGLRWLEPGIQTPPVATAKVDAPPAAVATAQAPRRGIHWDTPRPELENDLNAFLVQHSEFTPTSGMGVMSYVRIAGYDSNRE